MEEQIIMGIDWGKRRIGLAIGDNITRLATPYKVVSGINEVFEAINSEGVDVIVLGKPLLIDDAFRREFENFAANLSKGFGGPVEQVDERMTSKAADSLTGGAKTKAPRDALAAMIILQSYFDRNGPDIQHESHSH